MSQTNHVNQYCLFLDESGGFDESVKSGKSKPKTEHSQVVGFLAPYRNDITSLADNMIGEILQKARMSPNKQLHGKELSKATLNKLVEDLLPRMKILGWQPVRLVNEQQIEYGQNREINQTHIVAELVFRMFLETAKHAADPVTIHLKADWVSTATRTKKGYRPHIPPSSFLKPIQEYLGFAAVRRGLANEQKYWELKGPVLGNAKKESELQICDLLSNISFRGYDNCYPLLKPALQASFGTFDQTMETSDLLEHFDELESKYSYGRALILLAENLYHSVDGSNSKAIKNRLDHVLDRLVRIGSRARDAQLHFIVSWLDQIIGQLRMLSAGHEIALWLRKWVIKPLRDKLQLFEQNSSTIDWFDFAVNRWRMTAANHRGALIEAENALQAIVPLQPSLAGRWEHIPLLMDGFITQAVHQMDCFEFDAAAARMQWLADALGTQASGLQELMPQEIKQPLRYDLRAKALGTLTSTLILSGINNRDEMARVRNVSDQAIQEFVSLDDKARQYQLRCHLETVIGDFDQARLYLMRSLEPAKRFSSASYDQIIVGLRERIMRSAPGLHFLTAHWLRLGATAFLRENRQEAVAFSSAFQKHCKELTFSWLRDFSEFPVHIIFRYLAVIKAAEGNIPDAFNFLRHLRKITGNNRERSILRAIEITALAEVASVLWPRPEARMLLDSTLSQGTETIEGRLDFGIQQLLDTVLKKTPGIFPSLNKKFNDWQEKLDLLTKGEVSPDEARLMLQGIGREVFY